jgi:hypothetical protein
MMREIGREIVKIAAVAGEAGKADDGSRLRLGHRIVADMQTQIVEGRVI